MPKFSPINIFGSLILCSFIAIYIFPSVDREFLKVFSRQYADGILLAFLFLTIANKLITSKKSHHHEKLEPLFWYLIGAAFFSWFALTFTKLIVWENISPSKQSLIAHVSYFLFFALMVTAVEVKSFTKASKFLNYRSFITSLSVLTFVLGSFAYLILVRTQLTTPTESNIQNNFFFYAIMDSYLVLRWWHLAWQSKSNQSGIGFFIIGLANLNWLIADIAEYSILAEAVMADKHSPNSMWFDWLWYTPYCLFFIGIQKISNDNASTENNISEKNDTFSRHHLLNSPLFFLGLISILFLIEADITSVTDSDSLKNIQLSWLLVTLTLAIFQIIELFSTNKKRKFELKELHSFNDSIVQQLKQSAHELKSQSTSNQMILDTISNPIFTLDLSGKILSNNLAINKLLGYNATELINTSFSKLIPEDEEFHHFFDYQSYRQQLARNTDGLELESSVINKNGKNIAVHVTLSQSNRTTRNTLVVSLADIREQKKAEQKLHSLKDEFTANISHEFRTPLTIVNGVIEDLLSQSKDSQPSNDQSREQLQTAKRNNLRLIHMVDQLLELSRATSESVVITDIDATHWVEPICQSYNTIAKERNIDYGFSICTPLFIRGNQQAFENILYNLLSNAFKYTEKGDSINILLEEHEQSYQLTIADTGIGISKEEQGKIFDRFQRSEIDNQHSIPGAGIGLSLVKNLVNSMGWDINLESTLNKGSKFIVSIKKSIKNPTTALLEDKPILDEKQVSFLQAEMKQQDSSKAFSKSKHLILMIEDNIDMQRHLENIISPHHQCLVASNGKQGLSMAEEFLPDIIISDIMMQGIDGFEVLTTIKEQTSTTHIPVILLTAKSDEQSKLKGLAAEADDYLTKPFNAEELLLKINNQLKVRQKLQQKYEAQWQGFTKLNDERPNDCNDSLDNTFLTNLNQVFEHYYHDTKLSSAQLAHELVMGERQLQRKVKALVGVSPLELLKRYRLEQAKQQLSNNIQIGIVAQSCGFTSQSYFARLFKEHFGVTPTVYQQHAND